MNSEPNFEISQLNNNSGVINFIIPPNYENKKEGKTLDDYTQINSNKSLKKENKSSNLLNKKRKLFKVNKKENNKINSLKKKTIIIIIILI